MGVLKNFKNFTGKHLRWSLFLIKFRASGLELYLKETPTQVFSCEIVISLRRPFYTEHPRWLLLVPSLKSFIKEPRFIDL